MKIAVVDKDEQQLHILTDEICSHYFPEEDVFVYKFLDITEFIKVLFEGLQFKVVYVDNNTCDIVTIKTIQELLPETIIIGLSDDKNIIPLNNHQLLRKPYQPNDIHNSLLHSIKQATIKPNKIKVLDDSRTRYIELSKIYYFESYYGNVCVHTYKNKYIASNNFLYQYTDLLTRYGFIVIHKSILLNMDKIKSATIDEYTLLNDEVLYTSVRKRVQAFKTYTQYMEQKEKYHML